MIIARYILEIISDNKNEPQFALPDQRVLADMPARLEEIEENLTDLLPEGYSARIGEKR